MEAAIRSTDRPDRVGLDVPGVSAGTFSWRAVLAGASVATALALILLILGTGFGLTAISPWANEGASSKAIGIAAIAWLVFVHLSSAALGGYMSGRLRPRWTDVQQDEVFFRDTAQGLVAWAVGTILSAVLVSSAATSIVGGAAKVGAGAAAAGTAATVAAASTSSATAPFVDTLFRSERPREADDAAVREETGRVVGAAVRAKDIPAADRAYLSSLIAARTGISQPEAEKRVTEVIAQARAVEAEMREAADAARKALIRVSFWSVIALLIGAFAASFAATIGGRHRDVATRAFP